MSSINIFPTDKDVTLVSDNRIVNVEDNVDHTTVEVTQPITNVIHVLTGPAGPKGDQGDSTSLFVSGSDIFGTQVSASFSALQFDSDTGLNVTASNNRLTAIVSINSTVARTGSNSFVGDQTITGSLIVSGSSYFTGSLIPEASGSGQGIWDLGSPSNPWKDLYLASASINFVNNTGNVISTIFGEPDGIRIGSGSNNTLITTSSIQLSDSEGNTTTLTAESSTGSFYGSLTLQPQTSTPTAVAGGLFFSASNALYVGFS